MVIRKKGELDRGVSIRTYPSGERKLQVQFSIKLTPNAPKKTPCKEVLTQLDPDDPDDREYANHLRGMIMADIRKDEFDYAKYFPNSPKVKSPEHRHKYRLVKEYALEIREDLLRSKSDPGTKAFARKIMKPWIDSEIGRMLVIDLRQHHIRSWIRGETVSLNTIRDKLSGLRKVVDSAIDDDLIEKNPFKNLKVKKYVTAKQLKEAKKKPLPDPFTLEEIEAIIKSSSTLYGSIMANFIRFSFYTGLRPSEMFDLKWSNVTLTAQQQTVEVESVIVKGAQKDETKTDSSARTVILTKKAIEALQAQKQITGDREDGHVWVRPGEYGPFNDSDNLRERWIRILKHAGVRYRVPYQMRHTYASQLLSGGENIHFVAKMMGHADIEMCLKRYGKWIPRDEGENQHTFTSDFGR